MPQLPPPFMIDAWKKQEEQQRQQQQQDEGRRIPASPPPSIYDQPATSKMPSKDRRFDM